MCTVRSRDGPCEQARGAGRARRSLPTSGARGRRAASWRSWHELDQAPAGLHRFARRLLSPEQRPRRLAEEDLARARPASRRRAAALDDLGGEKLHLRLAACRRRSLRSRSPPGEGSSCPRSSRGGAHGPESVVLVQRGNPEDGDEALAMLAARHRAAVARDRLRDCRRELSLHEGARASGSRLPAGVRDAEGGDGHRLPHLARWAPGLGEEALPALSARRRLEFRLLAEDRALEPLEGGARLDPELLDEQLLRLLVGGERVGLAARPVEGEHELAAQALAERVLRRPGPRARRRARPRARGRARPRSAPRAGQAQLLEPRDLALGKRLVGEVGERGAAPERERLAKGRGRTAARRRPPAPAAFPGEALEAIQVELASGPAPARSRAPCVRIRSAPSTLRRRET